MNNQETGKYEKFNTLNQKKKLYFLISNDQDYLLGILQSFCHVSDCYIELSSLKDSLTFRDILRKEKPHIVFISMSQIEEIFRSAEWNEIQLILKEKKIPFCGIGNSSIIKDRINFRSIFTRIFEEPLNISEFMNFMHTLIAKSHDRRITERRKGTERRKKFLEYKVSLHPIISYSNGKNKNLAKQEKDAEQIISLGKLCIDYSKKSITIDGKDIKASRKEFQIIDLLVCKAGQVVTVDEIIERAWMEKHSKATKADVHQYLYILRHKLEKNPSNPQTIITVRGFGYKLCL